MLRKLPLRRASEQRNGKTLKPTSTDYSHIKGEASLFSSDNILTQVFVVSAAAAKLHNLLDSLCLFRIFPAKAVGVGFCFQKTKKEIKKK